MDGNVSFDYKKNSGLYIIGTSDYSFTTMWSECGINSIYCYRDHIKRIGYNPNYTQIPDKKELKTLIIVLDVNLLKKEKLLYWKIAITDSQQ